MFGENAAGKILGDDARVIPLHRRRLVSSAIAPPPIHVRTVDQTIQIRLIPAAGSPDTDKKSAVYFAAELLFEAWMSRLSSWLPLISRAAARKPSENGMALEKPSRSASALLQVLRRPLPGVSG